MRSKRRSSLRFALLSLALLSCALVWLVVGGMYFLFSRVEAVYGPPKPGIDIVERVYLSVELYSQRVALASPRDLRGIPQPFDVALGETPQRIATGLQQTGLIPDAGAFVAYLRYAGLDTTIQAGSYELSAAQSPIEIAAALQDVTPKEVTFSVLPGWRLEEIAAVLPTSGLEFSSDEFLAAARSLPSGYDFLSEVPTNRSLEGFLAPGIYEIPREASPNELLDVLLEGFDAQLAPDLLSGFESQGLGLYAAVTLASVVQREAVASEEMPAIASVFHNRLAIGMPLEADSTVQYALGYNDRQTTWWTNPLTSRDLQQDSPYNTYLNPGLPPSPIANPSAEALRAVAFPAQTPYYYFRAACDGSGRHLFATTFEEHLQNACEP